MNLILEAPLNSLSFGNVSFNIIRELHKLDVNLGIFPIGDPDLSAFDISDDLTKYIEDAINNRWKLISLSDGTVSQKQTLRQTRSQNQPWYQMVHSKIPHNRNQSTEPVCRRTESDILSVESQ